MRIATAVMLLMLFVCAIGFAQTRPGVRNIFVKDPGGLNIEMVESTN